MGLSLGSEDFAADVGMQSEPEGLFYPKQHTIFAARAAGIMPMGFIGSIADFRDQEAFRAIVRRSRRLGFMCAGAVHPLQVSVLNDEFSPDPVEVGRAERMIAAYEDCLCQGTGCGTVRRRHDRCSGCGTGAHCCEAGSGVAAPGEDLAPQLAGQGDQALMCVLMSDRPDIVGYRGEVCLGQLHTTFRRHGTSVVLRLRTPCMIVWEMPCTLPSLHSHWPLVRLDPTDVPLASAE